MRPKFHHAAILLAAAGFASVLASAAPAQQPDGSAAATYREIEATFGFVPGFF